jgi:hypothetical protein
MSHNGIIEKCQEILIAYPTPGDQCDRSNQKGDAGNIFCIDFHVLMGYFRGQHRKNMPGEHHQIM